MKIETEGEKLLRKYSRLLIAYGKLELLSGTASYRVKQTMIRIGKSLNTKVSALVYPTNIIATFTYKKHRRIEVLNISRVLVDVNKSFLIERLTRELSNKSYNYEYLKEYLKKIQNAKPLYNQFINAFATAIACSAFAFLVGGNWICLIGSFFGAFFGQLLRKSLLIKRLNQHIVTFCTVFLSIMIYVVVILIIAILRNQLSFNDLFHLFTPINSYITNETTPNLCLYKSCTIAGMNGYIAAVLFMVPGFPIMISALYLFKHDFFAGISRLSYGLLIILIAQFAVWIVGVTFGISPIIFDSLEISHINYIIFWGISTFLSVIGFAILFNSPIKMAIVAGAITTVVNIFRLITINYWHYSPIMMTFFAAFIIGVLARFCRDKFNYPRSGLTIPSVIIMFPGSVIFRAMFYINETKGTVDITQYGSGTNLTQAILVIFSIAIGLIVARFFTDRNWRYEDLKKIK